MKKSIIFAAIASLILVCDACARDNAQLSTITYNSYKGLVMAGYQGWFNAPGDGEGRKWHHYTGRNGFRPGSCTIDLWPDVSEYEKTYPTEFVMQDGSPARVFSPADYSTVDTHFRWMSEYGLDGVFLQRFLAEIANASGKAHFNNVLSHARKAANKYSRAYAIMYDLSGMPADGVSLLLSDIQELATEHDFFDHKSNPSYLYHNGKPLVTVWGLGFNDKRKYGLDEGEAIIDGLKALGFSVMIGVPTSWRQLAGDTIPDERLHALIRKCDIVMPWFVGRYREDSYPQFSNILEGDISWAKANGVDYAPLCFPGFSWENMRYPRTGSTIPRNHGKFFKMQLDRCLEAGAEMIYIAMFDEIDEGTAIFKLAKDIPVPSPGSTFVPLDDDVEGDLYLKLAGEAAKKLKTK